MTGKLRIFKVCTKRLSATNKKGITIKGNKIRPVIQNISLNLNIFITLIFY
jgi:hypothetical protein